MPHQLPFDPSQRQFDRLHSKARRYQRQNDIKLTEAGLQRYALNSTFLFQAGALYGRGTRDTWLLRKIN